MSLSDYSSMEQEILNAPEPTTLPKGTEVKARIIAVRTGISEKNGARWYSIVFDVPDSPLAKEFNCFMWDPNDRDKIEPKQFARNLDMFKKFVLCFNIDLTRPFSWEDDLPSKQGWLILGTTTDEYGDKNTVSKFIARR